MSASPFHTPDSLLRAYDAYYALMAARDLGEMADIARKANAGQDVSAEPRRILQALTDRGKLEP